MAVQYFSTCVGKVYERMAVWYFSVYFSRENIDRWLFSTSVHTCAGKEYKQRSVWYFSVYCSRENINRWLFSASVHVLAKYEQMAVWYFSVYCSRENINRWLFGASDYVLEPKVNVQRWLCGISAHVLTIREYQQMAVHYFSRCSWPVENISTWLLNTPQYMHLSRENINSCYSTLW